MTKAYVSKEAEKILSSTKGIDLLVQVIQQQAKINSGGEAICIVDGKAYRIHRTKGLVDPKKTKP